MLATTTSTRTRLLQAVGHAAGPAASDHAANLIGETPMTQPDTLTAALAEVLPGGFSLTGSLDRRLLIAQNAPTVDSWTVADLSGKSHATRTWPQWTESRLILANPHGWLSTTRLSDDAVYRLQRPRVLLVALYHPEWFPLPRFPLGISDVARAARSTLLGQVRLLDMQMGVTEHDILSTVEDWQPDILGVSVTFGQHDLMSRLLDHVYTLESPPLVLAGGSLTARNEKHLLDRYPRLVLARGAGEPAIADMMSYYHGDLAITDVRGIGYAGGARGGALTILGHRRTATMTNRTQTDILPELDLLDATFARRGVAQLEASRGCTNFCSFCPRGHKGTWAGAGADTLTWILHEMRDVFDRHPTVSRTLYLVDEEFIGRDADAVPRALDLADTLHGAGFRWESSCRVDQVVDPGRDRDWHLERARLWRELVQKGLRRMLFGVESGVTSILARFNKETTADQNALAIRTLSALGVPTRFTYITFDHLMNVNELEASRGFQARTDLLLRPAPGLTVEEIVDGVRDESFVRQHALGRPLFIEISYMLVSMECLIGAAYTRQVQAAGLAGATRQSMGRVDADFADWRIGRCSHHAQLWVDRHFALDYTLKSLEKILDGAPRHLVREARGVIKTAGFNLLTRMLRLIHTTPAPELDSQSFDRALNAAMDDELARLVLDMNAATEAVLPALPTATGLLLRREHERWLNAGEWRLINSADPCGT